MTAWKAWLLLTPACAHPRLTARGRNSTEFGLSRTRLGSLIGESRRQGLLICHAGIVESKDRQGELLALFRFRHHLARGAGAVEHTFQPFDFDGTQQPAF